MTTTSRQDTATGPAAGAVTYRITVGGHLDDHWSAWLGGHALVRNGDSTTTITLEAPDQARLHGVLTGVRDLGVALLSLHTVDETPDGTLPEPVLAHTLHTERLTLRPATEADADATWTYRSLNSVNEWLTGVPSSRDDYRATFVAPPRLATTVMVELGDPNGGAVIGDFMLRREDAWSHAEMNERARGAQAELGWVLDPVHTGAGYATEAVGELVRYCFEELGVHRVVATCFLANVTAWRLMERIGMRREAHALAESLHRSGRWLDTVAYAILADEWRARSENG